MDGRWWRMACLLVAGRALDLAGTYAITPDLAKEANPLAGGGWALLVTVNVLFTAACLALYAYALRRPGLGASGLRGWKAMAHDQFGPGVPAWHIWWRFPVKGRWLYALGWWYGPAFAVGTFPVFAINALMVSSREYQAFVRTVAFGSSLLYVVELVTVLVATGLCSVVAWRARPGAAVPAPPSPPRHGGRTRQKAA